MEFRHYSGSCLTVIYFRFSFFIFTLFFRYSITFYVEWAGVSGVFLTFVLPPPNYLTPYSLVKS